MFLLSFKARKFWRIIPSSLNIYKQTSYKTIKDINNLFITFYMQVIDQGVMKVLNPYQMKRNFIQVKNSEIRISYSST